MVATGIVLMLNSANILSNTLVCTWEWKPADCHDLVTLVTQGPLAAALCHFSPFKHRTMHIHQLHLVDPAQGMKDYLFLMCLTHQTHSGLINCSGTSQIL